MATKLKKNGKISVGDIEKAVKDIYVPIKQIEWRGLTIDVKNTLNLDEMRVFVRSVITACFDANGVAYHPEMKDFAMRSVLIELYTNVSLPSGIDRIYDVVYCSDLVDVIYGAINQKQFEIMMDAVNDEIDYVINSNVEAVTKQVNTLSDTIEKLGEKFKGLFDGVDPEDIRKTLSAIGEGGINEEKLMKAYLGQTKEKSGE